LPFALQLHDQRIRGILLVGAAQRRDHGSMVGLQVVQHSSDAAEQRRRRQQPQRVPGRRGVDDHRMKLRGHAGDFQQADDLVDAGQRQLEEARDVFLVEVGAAQRDGREQRAPGRQPSIEGSRGLDIGDVQMRRPRYGRGCRAHGDTEDVRERGCGVGGHQEGPPFGPLRPLTPRLRSG
jgi:hypothetical protein